MRNWAKEHGLLLANIALFVVFFGGMILSGAASYSEEQQAHGEPAVSVLQFLGTGEFLEATFENWESEFLQMGMYVVLTIFLFQKGSSESKPVDKEAPQDEDPRDAAIKKATPWPVKQGGVALKLYEHSLSILFFALFLASMAMHAVGGTEAYTEDQQSHGEHPAIHRYQQVLVRVVPELAKRVPGRRRPGRRLRVPPREGLAGVQACS